jgi:hypothetical protein
MSPTTKAAFACVLLVSGWAAAASAQSSATGVLVDPARAKERLQAMAGLAESDPELANHFGLFASRPVSLQAYGGKLVAVANIVTALTGTRTGPEAMNELASKERLFSENAYGAGVVLDGEAMCRLLSLAMKGRFAVTLAHRVEGRIPREEAREAEGSEDLFVILAYLDHTPMIESSFVWSGDGSIARVRVVNPLAAVAGAVPYKARTDYDPAAFDAWEFFRFRKAIR